MSNAVAKTNDIRIYFLKTENSRNILFDPSQTIAGTYMVQLSLISIRL